MAEQTPNPSTKIETIYGPIFVTGVGRKTAVVEGDQLMVDGIALSASGTLTSPDGLNFSLVRQFSAEHGFSTPASALKARLVDGRDADVVILGKLAEVIVPAVRKFAQTDRRFFLDAERRALKGRIEGLASVIEQQTKRLEETKKELAQVEAERKSLGLSES